MQPQESVLRLRRFIHQREHQPRQIRVAAVEEAVRTEMNDAVLIQLTAHRQTAVGLEVERLQT
jgi:hypothetical protein